MPGLFLYKKTPPDKRRSEVGYSGLDGHPLQEEQAPEQEEEAVAIFCFLKIPKPMWMAPVGHAAAQSPQRMHSAD